MKPNINGSFPSTQAGWGALQGVRRPFGASFYFEAAKVSAKEGNRAPASCSMEKLPGQQQGATLISRLRCQHCPAGTLGCTGSLASAELEENWDNWEMHIGLDVSCCLGMQRYVSMEEELPRAREEKQQPELGKQRELTDSTTGRECQMHTHTWTAGARSLDPPGTHCWASFLWVFTLICKSVKTHTETLSRFWIALWKQYSLGQGACRRGSQG